MTLNVSQILSNKYGISAQPGSKVECPFCRHETFSIKRDNTLGKCFHPTCGRYVTAVQQDYPYRNNLRHTMMEIFEDFHRELLALKDAEYNNAYSYLVRERGIHPRVVANSMLGAVPPSYNRGSKFDPLLRDIGAAIKDDQEAHPGKNGRSSKAASQTTDLRWSPWVRQTVKTLLAVR
jgi:hypothetical protein